MRDQRVRHMKQEPTSRQVDLVSCVWTRLGHVRGRKRSLVFIAPSYALPLGQITQACTSSPKVITVVIVLIWSHRKWGEWVSADR